MNTTTEQSLAKQLINQFEASSNIPSLIGEMDEVDNDATSDDMTVIHFVDGSRIMYDFQSGWKVC
jgi:hypothetical protein